jgi:hypothetical protein
VEVATVVLATADLRSSSVVVVVVLVVVVTLVSVKFI